MGLLDVLNGMQNGPRGQTTPGSGMSPLTMALLGLLAYKAVKSFTANQPNTPPGNPGTQPNSNSAGGGLGGLLTGGLGGLLTGAAGGSALSGGLNDLLKQFEQNGHGDTANSWVGNGQNKSISPGDLEKALGGDKINELMSLSGLSRDELLNGLSQHLPNVVDQLTPHGRLPTEQEATHTVS
jgi:uncharacterized protein YidB (DUF937 family)